MTASAHARAREEHIRALLVLAANTIHPVGDGLDVIRARTIERRPWWRRLTPTRRTAAPGQSGAAAKAAPLKGSTAMTTIISRHARDLHAGDIIVHDPDHDRPVRWRVTRPPVITSDGEYALADYTDVDSGGHGIAYYRVLTGLSVEPAGGAA